MRFAFCPITSEHASRILYWKYAKPDELHHCDRDRDSAPSNKTLLAQDEISELTGELPLDYLDRAAECPRTSCSTHKAMDG